MDALRRTPDFFLRTPNSVLRTPRLTPHSALNPSHFLIYLILLIAPAIYWFLGVGIVRRFGFDNGLSMLMGGAVAGLAVEAATISGVSPATMLSLLTIVAIVFFVSIKDTIQWRAEFQTNAIAYVIALVPAVASPFAILGTWDGDWLILFQGGQAVFHGEALVGKLLERPPMFGASAAPLWLIQDSLASYQVFCAVMSAGLLVLMHSLSKKYFPDRDPIFVLLPLVLSAFFLHHTAACWGKFMAAAFVLAAILSACEDAPKQRFSRAAVLFAISVAVHQSSIFYILLVAVVYWQSLPMSVTTVFRCLSTYAFVGIVLVGSFELWTIGQYGLQAKINANPAASQRPTDLSFIASSSLILLTSFFGWGPLSNLSRWFSEPNPMGTKNILSEGFWLTTSWLQTSAGTFLGIALPSLVASPGLLVRGIRSKLTQPSNQTISLTIAFVLILVLNSLVNPFHSPNGSMQTGLVPLGVMLAWSLGIAVSTSESSNKAVAQLSIVFFVFPWMSLMLLVTIGMRVSEPFRFIIENGSEGDWGRLVETSLTPLGLSVFPIAHLVVLSSLIVAGRYIIQSLPKERSSVQVSS